MTQELQDPDSAELGLTLYQLATTYYANDMLTDAGPVLQRATTLLRSHYPAEHDLVRHNMLCVVGMGAGGGGVAVLLMNIGGRLQW